MPIATFKLQPLLDIIEQTKHLPNKPTGDDLYNNDYWDTVPLNKEGLTEGQFAKESGNKGMFFPDSSKINESKLPNSFSLVGDHGVYMLPNKVLGKTPSESGFVVHAKGCNPDIDEDFYENKRVIFGGDDGAIQIPFEWVLIAKENNNEQLKIKLNQDSVSLVSNKVGNKPKKLVSGMLFSFEGTKYELVSANPKSRGAWKAQNKNTLQYFTVTAKQLREAFFILK